MCARCDDEEDATPGAPAVAQTVRHGIATASPDPSMSQVTTAQNDPPPVR
jgi:hypothetical protein